MTDFTSIVQQDLANNAYKHVELVQKMLFIDALPVANNFIWIVIASVFHVQLDVLNVMHQAVLHVYKDIH